jgi:hypothetical protein
MIERMSLRDKNSLVQTFLRFEVNLGGKAILDAVSWRQDFD